MSRASDQDIVNIGMVLAGVAELKVTVQHLSNEVMRLRHELRKLPCRDDGDTNPDCPALLSDAPPSHRERLASMSDEEPDSVVTRPISVHAGQFAFRGPGIMVGIVVVLLGVIGGAVLVLRPMIAQAWH
jgi:uncharacterized small protein (DUF1192 family)